MPTNFSFSNQNWKFFYRREQFQRQNWEYSGGSISDLTWGGGSTGAELCCAGGKQEEGNVFYMTTTRVLSLTPGHRQPGKIENQDEFSSHRANIFNHVNQFEILSLAVCYDTPVPRCCYCHAWGSLSRDFHLLCRNLFILLSLRLPANLTYRYKLHTTVMSTIRRFLFFDKGRSSRLATEETMISS